MTFTLDDEIEAWVKEQVEMDPEGNQSKVGRRVFREAMARDKAAKGKK